MNGYAGKNKSELLETAQKVFDSRDSKKKKKKDLLFKKME
jgi:hypothetical protein